MDEVTHPGQHLERPPVLKEKVGLQEPDNPVPVGLVVGVFLILLRLVGRVPYVFHEVYLNTNAHVPFGRGRWCFNEEAESCYRIYPPLVFFR
jgi:hypothetical protein